MKPYKVILLCLAGLISIWGLTAAIWGLGVATAGIYGRGEQIKQVNSGTNRTFQYNHFFDLYNDVKSQTTQIKNTKQAIANETDSTEKSRLNSVVLGL